MAFPFPASAGARNRIKDHMTPRSSSQSPECDSRHNSPAMTVPMVWIRARVVLVSAKVLRLRR